MPIDLTKVASSKVQMDTYSPKFFNKALTGSGGKVGVLNVDRNPININVNFNTSQEAFRDVNRKIANNGASIHAIPMHAISRSMWGALEWYRHPEIPEMTKLATIPHVGSLYIHTRMFSAVLRETPSTMKKGSVIKQYELCYQIGLYVITDNSTDNKCRIRQKRFCGTENECIFYFTSNPARKLTSLTASLPRSLQPYVTAKTVADYIGSLSAFDMACKETEHWHKHIHDDIETVAMNLIDIYNANYQNSYTTYDELMLRELSPMIQFIETYSVPLTEYREIYKTLQTIFNGHDKLVQMLCKQNLNLLLSDMLNDLKNHKSQIPMFVPNTNSKTPMSLNKFSPEQIKALTSTDPLTIVQAGAGTGKSTVILGRIDYLCSVGVKPEDITVLSFTNAAANHINDKNPYVHSMTIAAMIHTIYENNFPTHRLAPVDTLRNTLNRKFPPVPNRDPFIRQFVDRLTAFIKNDTDAYTAMNNFVEDNYDKVIDVLNQTRQTTLELEIIICYQQIDKLVEPDSVKSKYLIVDEVQDNSIFEFVYVLKYITKHLQNLFIVGDCSQTLYEFRASNPKALNIMESSGVFTPYQLNTNYRSNQEILDFANIILKNIEANQYANIQLQSNTLGKVTYKSFTDKVQLHYEQLVKMTGFQDAIPTWLDLYVKPYIEEKLKYNESVTFLAFTRDVIFRIQKWLEETYPDKTIANIVPERVPNSTIFSSFIMKYWNDMKFMPSQNLVTTICQEILNRLDSLTNGNAAKARASVSNMLMQWAQSADADVTAWFNQYQNGQLTKDEYLDLVENNMVDYEINHNAIRQSLIAKKNEENKKLQNASSANFILSTIHSAKGLEFENVVVMFRNENDLPEDKKRMYYVALTRAMKSEFILAYDTSKSPQIEADYKAIVHKLKEKKNAVTATTVSP